MFPSIVFRRRTYDAIQTPHHGTAGDLEYLRISATSRPARSQADVEAALGLLLRRAACSITSRRRSRPGSRGRRKRIDDAPRSCRLTIDLARV
jgi:hypothetical protein